MIVDNTTRTARMHIGREGVTDGTTAPSAAVDTIDNLWTALLIVSGGHGHRSWCRVLCRLFSEALLA